MDDICMRRGTTAAPAPPPRLIIIAVSHFCEKATWALQRFGLLHVSCPACIAARANLMILRQIRHTRGCRCSRSSEMQISTFSLSLGPTLISQGLHRGAVRSVGGKGSTPCLAVTDSEGKPALLCLVCVLLCNRDDDIVE
jgi:hypothetical protein